MVELRKHQEPVLDQLRTGVILQGGVGSGKSITGLAYYYTRELCGELNPLTKPKNNVSLYIITTAKKRDALDWDRECSRFALSKNSEASINGIKVVIDSWNNIGKYVDVENAFFIFDEQRLVGSGSWVKSFIKISKKNHWIVLTATPGDTWIDYAPIFIANGLYKNKTEFTIKHVVFSPYSKYPKISHYVDVETLIKHRAAVVIQMSYRHDIKIHKTSLKAKYDEAAMLQIIKKRWNPFTNKPIRNPGEFTAVQRKLVNSDPSRLALLKETFHKHPKLIVFYNFNYELFMIRDFFIKEEIPWSEWNGHRHEDILTGESWIYLVQYTAGAEGWECIQTNTIFFYSQNYSYKIKVQSEGRVDRLNTPFKDLYYYYAKSDSIIDKAIGGALALKRNFNEQEYESRFA